MRFENRADAGEQLAMSIEISDPSNTIILALPRGGVPLGIAVAKKYAVSFDVILAKKIGHPFHSEYAIGAIAEGGAPLFNEAEKNDLDSGWINEEVLRIRKDMKRRRARYDQVLKKKSLSGKDVILVDDGIATGMTMFAAIEAVKKEGPDRIIIAVPIIPKDTYCKLKKQVDQVYSVDVPEYFLGAVGAYYRHFPQLQDEEVQKWLLSIQSE